MIKGVTDATSSPQWDALNLRRRFNIDRISACLNSSSGPVKCFTAMANNRTRTLIPATILSGLLLAALNTTTQAEVLFIHSPVPIMNNRVAADLPHHHVTPIVVGMSFAQDGKVRRTWMIKSSNSMIADAWIRDWIGRKWQADPALLRQGSFRGKPFTTETQFSFPIALTIP
jgi:hypothetical protein